MANITKQKRDEMLAFLEQLKADHNDDESIRAFNEIQNHLTEKKFGLVFEEHTEEVDEKLLTHIPVLCADEARRICKDESKPWNFIIEGDNLQALYLLEKTHRGKVDCIYIDPPYNTGAKDWKYNNDYVDGQDVYRHSKWLSMMKTRLLIAKRLLNPTDSVLIVTIDEKEYLHLGCLLEELFPDAKIQMISSVINPSGSSRSGEFSRSDEYIFFVMNGEAYPIPTSTNMLVEQNEKNSYSGWDALRRRGATGKRTARPNLFYPIYFDKETGKCIKSGNSIPLNVNRNDIKPNINEFIVWPIASDGTEMTWGVESKIFEKKLKKGYIQFGKFDHNNLTRSIYHLQQGGINAVEKGELKVIGRTDDGTVVLDESSYKRKIKPLTTWNMRSHNATEFGTNLLKKILCDGRFSYPKSLYAIRDCINFFVVNKTNAIILDFFAGSGTALHAVNLLNAEDGGNRRCIMVTNNEISLEEEKRLTKGGYKKGDDEWEALGIAKYVTWPRTECSINGVDTNGNALKGEYLTSDSDGNIIPMSKGFISNVKFFKCDWTPRKPEDYLLSNALCLHIREMIELQNHIEIDNKKYVLILNKSDFNKYVMDPDVYEKIEKIWVNQNIVFGPDQLKLLRAKNFKYVPREFFGQELREAAE